MLMADFVPSTRARCWWPATTAPSSTGSPPSVVELDLAQQRIGHYTGAWTTTSPARDLERRHAREAYEEYAGERDPLLAQSRQRADWAAKGRRNVAMGDEPDKHLREKPQGPRRPAGRQGAPGLERAADRLDAVAQPRKEWQLRYSITAGPASADVVATLDRCRATADFQLGPLDLIVAAATASPSSATTAAASRRCSAALLGDLPLTSGRHPRGHRVSVGVIDQQRRLLETTAPVVDVVRRAWSAARADAGSRRSGSPRCAPCSRSSGSAPSTSTRPARSLSMGERTRALLAIFQGREVNVLVLDEPTNHLDVPAIEQLESALAASGARWSSSATTRACATAYGSRRCGRSTGAG